MTMDKTINIKYGDFYDLTLSHNLTAGYVWHLESEPSFLKTEIIKTAEEHNEKSDQFFIGTRSHYFNLRITPIKLGKGLLILRLRRPWDYSDIAEELAIKVNAFSDS